MNSYTRPSLETVHDSARLGATVLSGIGFTSASCMAYSIMNGVITAGVSAGSNHVGASETWTAHVTWPSGAAETGAPALTTRANRTRATARLMEISLGWGHPSRVPP